MESRSEAGSFKAKVRVDDLPNAVRGELVELGVRLDDAVKLADGWELTVRGDRVGATIGLLVGSGLRVLSADRVPPDSQGKARRPSD